MACAWRSRPSDPIDADVTRVEQRGAHAAPWLARPHLRVLAMASYLPEQEHAGANDGGLLQMRYTAGPRRFRTVGFRGLGHVRTRTENPSVAGTGSAALYFARGERACLRGSRPVAARSVAGQ